MIQRADDTKETVATRLDVNIRQQEPLLQYYKGQGVLHAINGEADVEEVFEQVSEVLESCTERG